LTARPRIPRAGQVPERQGGHRGRRFDATPGQWPPRKRAPRPCAHRRPRRRPAPVAAGDTLPRKGDAAARAERVARRSAADLVAREMTIADLVSARKSTPAGALVKQLRALLAAASPDEARALERAPLRPEPAPADGVDPDTELAPGWRDGAHPYRNLLSRKAYEKQKCPSAEHSGRFDAFANGAFGASGFAV